MAFLRGINVGGKHSLPMKELTALLLRIGLRNARTYIQSGNAVFRSEEESIDGISARIGLEIKRDFGFEPSILVLSLPDLEDAIAHNPFPEAGSEPESLHLGFLAEDPRNPNMARLETLKKATERFALIGRVFYLNAPEGVGRSKLAASSESLLGVPMTDRNWRTVCKMKDMARELGD